MSYDEHLITQAGGDVLDAIQRRSDVAMDYPGMVTIEQSQADVPALLALVREQAAKLDAAKGLVSTWGEYPSSPEGHYAFELRIALRLTA